MSITAVQWERMGLAFRFSSTNLAVIVIGEIEYARNARIALVRKLKVGNVYGAAVAL